MSDIPSTDNAGCLMPGLGVIFTFLGLAAILVGRFLIGFLFLGSGVYMLYSYQRSREDVGERKITPDNRSKRWMAEAGQKLGVPPDLIARAFSRGEDRTDTPDSPLEIPDVMAITYKYSYGGISRFFREVRDQARLMGSHCRRCAFVYLPPRVRCSQCYESTQWVPVGPEGTVRTCTTVHYATSAFFRKTPYVCAYVQVDGADTLLLHNVVTENPGEIRPGCRVKVHFREREERVGEMGDFFFIPTHPSTEKNPGGQP